MPKPLVDISPKQMAKATEVNCEQFAIHTAHSVGGQVHKQSDVTWVISTQPGGANQIVSPRFKSDATEQRLDEILKYYAEAQQFLNIMLGPSTRPKNLENHLRDYGLHCYSRSSPMICDLGELVKYRKHLVSLSVDVQRDFAVFEHREHPYIGRISTPLRRARLQSIQSMVEQKPNRIWHFIASRDGVPLGAATLCIGGGVAGLYGVGVVKKARRQGIGTAVTAGACAFAHQLGYRAATLFASGQGKYLYPHLGFEFIGTFSHWSYSKTQQRKHQELKV